MIIFIYLFFHCASELVCEVAKAKQKLPLTGKSVSKLVSTYFSNKKILLAFILLGYKSIFICG